MSLFVAAARLQARQIFSDRDYTIELVRAPLLSVVFLALVRQAGRPDLLANALLAPVLMALFGMALSISGEIVDADRWLGLLEPTIATPVPFPRLVLHRILTTTLVSLIIAVEVCLVSIAGFRVVPAVHHPWVLAAAAVVTLAAMAGWSLLMSALFVATRTARTFQNTLSYPFMLLGGVFVPVDQLPQWMRPAARLVFLSWSSDLLRDAMAAPPVTSVAARLGMVVLLGAAGLGIGLLTLRRVLRRVRATGTLGLR